MMFFRQHGKPFLTSVAQREECLRARTLYGGRQRSRSRHPPNAEARPEPQADPDPINFVPRPVRRSDIASSRGSRGRTTIPQPVQRTSPMATPASSASRGSSSRSYVPQPEPSPILRSPFFEGQHDFGSYNPFNSQFWTPTIQQSASQSMTISGIAL